MIYFTKEGGKLRTGINIQIIKNHSVCFIIQWNRSDDKSNKTWRHCFYGKRMQAKGYKPYVLWKMDFTPQDKQKLKAFNELFK